MTERKANKRVLLLFDFPEPIEKNVEFRSYFHGEGWESERDVCRALERLGFEVGLCGLFDDLGPLLKMVREFKPHYIFNLCESFGGARAGESAIASVLSTLDVPITGSNAASLALCKNKALSKSILRASGITVPHFFVVRKEMVSHSRSVLRDRVLSLWQQHSFLSEAWIVKPLDLDSSQGIAKASVVRTGSELIKRALFLMDRYECDVIVEQFIVGRELYVGVLGGRSPVVLPCRELFFGSKTDPLEQLLTYRSKWDDRYRKTMGVKSGFGRALRPEVLEEVRRVALQGFQALGMAGYARFDLRVDDQGKVFVLEANPNPSIARTDDFASAAEKSGYSYPDLIKRIIKLAA